MLMVLPLADAFTATPAVGVPALKVFAALVMEVVVTSLFPSNVLFA